MLSGPNVFFKTSFSDLQLSLSVPELVDQKTTRSQISLRCCLALFLVCWEIGSKEMGGGPLPYSSSSAMPSSRDWVTPADWPLQWQAPPREHEQTGKSGDIWILPRNVPLSMSESEGPKYVRLPRKLFGKLSGDKILSEDLCLLLGINSLSP